MLKKSGNAFNEDVRCKLQIVIELFKLLKDSEFSDETVNKMHELTDLLNSISERK